MTRYSPALAGGLRTTTNPAPAPQGKGPIVVLIGPSGAGKTTVAGHLARHWQVAPRDTDLDVAAMAGMTIAEIFATDGEATFRELEANAVIRALALHEGVLALGGGAITTPAVRTALAQYLSDGGHIAYLEVSEASASNRLGFDHPTDETRPLLAANPRANWRTLLAQRRADYQQAATITVDADAPAREVAAAIAAAIANAPVRVTVAAASPYPVVIGEHLLGELAPALGTEVTRVLVVCPAPLATYGSRVEAALAAAGYETHCQVVPDAEAQKTAGVAAACWQRLGELAFTRTDAVVAVGGGATTDLAGWVAATWLRGIKVVHYPTTLLAMVDAAVGGKTGINTAEGKNLVGSFHTPAAVICDLTTLATLPRADFVAGLAEVAKTGFIADPVILDLLTEHASQLRAWPPADPAAESWPVVRELVMRSVAVKARVVAADLTEQGEREFLNYGHTLGHAIEHAEHYGCRHGEAVAVGMVFAAELARAAGVATQQLVDRHRQVLSGLVLPTSYANHSLAELLPAMRRDKKTRGHHLRFVVLRDVGAPQRLVNPNPELLAEAFARIQSPGSCTRRVP